MIRRSDKDKDGEGPAGEEGIEATNTLLSKSEMLAEVSSLCLSRIHEDPGGISLKAKKQFIYGPTRSRNLWSKKSSELYSQLITILTDEKPMFLPLKNMQSETCIGVINTFISSASTLGSLDRIYSSWSFYNKSFVIKKV
jgi:hypothetical protein